MNVCLFCKEDKENINHVLLRCPSPTIFWAWLPGISSRNGQWPQNVSSLMHQLWNPFFSSVGLHLLRIMVVALLHFQICRFLKTVIACSAVSWTYVALPFFVVPNLSPFAHFRNIIKFKKSCLSLRCVWVKPPAGWFKLNFDSSVQGPRSGGGVLLWDHQGVTLWSLLETFHSCEVNEAELFELKMLHLVLSSSKIIIEGNSVNVIG
ncbi:hypothetical protein AMTRI_Chr08g164800 [Amborella trichopoda]